MNKTPTKAAKTDLVYDIHVFSCINERAPDHPRGSCAARGAVDLQAHMKARAKELKIKGIRVNKAGCLDRCELGPVLVIYPEATWYHYDTIADVDEILERHIIGGEIVEHLLLRPDQKLPDPVAEFRLSLRVNSIKKLTGEVRKFELVPQGELPLPPFEAGSHIDIFTATGLRRSYSLANDPAETHRYEIAVLREKNGRGGAAWMHDHLAVDDTIEITLPRNTFAIDPTARRHVLIAGGIGITPLLSMARQFAREGTDFRLHYCARYPENAPYMSEIKQAFDGRVSFHFDGGDPAKGLDLDALLKEHTDGTCLSVCGPPGLIEATRAAASHWPDGTVRFELFAPSETTPETPNKPFNVVLSRQGLTLSVPATKSILEVVRAAGVEAESSCEAGLCGACRVRLLDGRADHRDSVLDEAEKTAQNTIMICSSRAEDGETLILDI